MTAAGWGHAGVVAATAAGAAVLPEVLSLYATINATSFVVLAILALSLGLVWGFGGIVCFGQTAFFGIGGYAYAVAAINFGDSTLAAPVAALAAAAFALILGWVMFYGRVGGVYVGVITLTATLILYKLVNATAGPEYAIGAARLGGANGMPATPPLNLPFDPASPLGPEASLRVALAALAACYLAGACLLAAPFGRVAVAIRENPLRAALLGYDARPRRTLLFVVGGAMAGLAGALYAATSFVSPAMFGLGAAAQLLVWTVAGGLGTLIGPVLGAVAIQYLTLRAGELGVLDPALSRIDSNAVMGLLLIAVVIAAPRGVWPSLRRLAAGRRR